MKKTLLMAISMLAMQAFAQGTGEIKGVVIDPMTNESIIGANVWVEYAGDKIGTVTDIDGRYTLKPIPSGTYNIKYSFVGKSKKSITGILVKSDKVVLMDPVALEDNAILLDSGFVVEAYRVKLIDPEEPSRRTLDAKQISQIAGAGRGGNTLITIAGDGAVKTDGEGRVYFRGSRAGQFVTFMDGVKIRGNAPKVPAGALKSYTVYTGGLPAKYGDTMGGVVVIETKNYFDLYNQKVAQQGINY